MAGLLQVVGTPIGNLGDLSPRAAESLEKADVIACEDTRRTRKLLSASGIAAREMVALHAHNEKAQTDRLLGRLQSGTRVALVSDAGMPSVSDPGQALVEAAVRAGVRVEVVPGPSAVIAALVLSGMVTDRFVFEGFLPRKGRARALRLRQLATEARTAVVFESPHRLGATLAELAGVCGEDRAVAVARELTKVHEEVWRGTLAQGAARYAEEAPKGEVVIVLGGAPPAPRAGEDEVRAALVEALAGGADRKAAVAAVAAELGVPKRLVYGVAVALGPGRGHS